MKSGVRHYSQTEVEEPNFTHPLIKDSGCTYSINEPAFRIRGQSPLDKLQPTLHAEHTVLHPSFSD